MEITFSTHSHAFTARLGKINKSDFYWSIFIIFDFTMYFSFGSDAFRRSRFVPMPSPIEPIFGWIKRDGLPEKIAPCCLRGNCLLIMSLKITLLG
jgi:hypothetical protein